MPSSSLPQPPRQQPDRARRDTALSSDRPTKERADRVTRMGTLPALGRGHLAVISGMLLVICVGLLAWSVYVQGDLQSSQQALSTALAERDTLRQRATATVYRLSATLTSAPATGATVFVPIEGSAVLSATNLPRLGTNQRFQLWYHPANDGRLIPGGTFERDEHGNGFMLIPGDIGPFRELLISIEPASGSTSPTGPTILKGDASSARG